MIDDFGVGPRRRQAAYDDPLRRQPQYMRRVPAGDGEAEAIAVAFDDPMWSPADLPVPTVNPLFNTTPDDGGNDFSAGNNRLGSAGDQPPQAPWHKRLADKLSHKQWLFVAGALVLIGGAGSVYALTRPEPAKQAPVAAKPQPKPAPPPPPPVSPLTGAEVPVEDTKRPVTGVMIENSIMARPQSGLIQAGVVYEAIAEYGITRFLALYQEAKPGNLGPVRSVRPYYVDWATAYDAPIAHVGGSPDALAKIKREGVKDLDQFFNAPYYHRISSRFAPSNMYTNMTELDKAKAAKGWTTSNFTGFPRKKAAPAAVEKRNANRVDIAISGPTYNIHYDYNPAANTYNRVMAGTPHVDADTKAQISPSVVIGLITAYGLEPDGYHSKYQTTGSGEAIVFQDGVATLVSWKRETGASPYAFSLNDKPLPLNPGQTWITVVGSKTAVTHAP